MSSAWEIAPGGVLRGRVEVPGDKSISHRALLLAALADGDSELSGVLDSGDCRAMAGALRALGARLDETAPGCWRVAGRGPEALRPPPGPLDLGNSGTAMRLLCGALASRPFGAVLTGDASLSARPMERVAAPLRAMGARISTTDGCPPLRLEPAARPLAGIDHPEPVRSAQVKSALLLAGLEAAGRTCLREAGAARDHTERMLPAFGGVCERDGDRLCVAGGQRLRGAVLAVPRDLSAAAFFIVGALIAPGSELELPGVGVNPRRAGALRILRRMGAAIELAPRPDAGGEPVADLRVRAGALEGVEVEPELAPAAIDEFPVLCIAAACARGTTTFAGVGELRVKESDRIAAMADGLAALGVTVETGGDWLRVHGGALGGGAVDSRADHRVAMAFAVAALAAADPVRVRDPGWVAASFPDFAAQARAAGLRLADA